MKYENSNMLPTMQGRWISSKRKVRQFILPFVHTFTLIRTVNLVWGGKCIYLYHYYLVLDRTFGSSAQMKYWVISITMKAAAVTETNRHNLFSHCIIHIGK